MGANIILSFELWVQDLCLNKTFLIKRGCNCIHRTHANTTPANNMFFFHNILGGNALAVSTSQRRYGCLSDDRTKCHMPDSPPHGIHFHLAHHRKVRLFTVINQLRDCDIIMTYLFRILNYEKINHIDHFEY